MTDWDHVPPISVAAQLAAKERHKLLLIKVPSCRDCNIIAGKSYQYSIRERQLFIRKKLENRYRRLRLTYWTDDELNELKGNLKRYVSAHGKMAKKLKERMEFIENAAECLD